MRILIIILSLLLFTSCSIFVGNTYTIPGGEGLEPGNNVVLRFIGCRDVRIDGYRLHEMNLVNGDVKLHKKNIAKRESFKAKVIVTPGRHIVEISDGYSKYNQGQSTVIDDDLFWVSCGQVKDFHKGSLYDYIYEIGKEGINRDSFAKSGLKKTYYGKDSHYCYLLCIDCW